MKTFKLFVAVLLTLFVVACSAVPPVDKPANPNKAIVEKNKQIDLLNEVGKIVRDAQSIEKLGRNMNSYRLGLDAESRRVCNVVMTENQRTVMDLEVRVNNLPDNYKEQLTPIVTDLNECISCSKKALDRCVKSRASVNKVIKEIYP